MSCVLSIRGKNLNPEKVLNGLTIKPYLITKKGDPVRKTKPNGEKQKSSGIHFLASNADFDQIDKQIRDTIKYLKKHEKEIKKITFNKQTESACLDFGFYSEVGLNNVAVQSEIFPHELLKLAGGLKINLEISLY